MNWSCQHVLSQRHALHLVLGLVLTIGRLKGLCRNLLIKTGLLQAQNDILPSQQQPETVPLIRGFSPPTKMRMYLNDLQPPCWPWWISVHIPQAFSNISHKIWHSQSWPSVVRVWMILNYGGAFFFFRTCELVKCFCLHCYVLKLIWWGVATGPRGEGGRPT